MLLILYVHNNILVTCSLFLLPPFSPFLPHCLPPLPSPSLLSSSLFPPVHSFSCMLIENTLSYNEHGKSEAAAALRLISTQVPALKSALEVMVEQCATRYCQKSFSS